jgi:hypothetical protein
MAVDQDLGIGTDRVAHRADDLDRVGNRPGIGIAPRIGEGIELEPAIALVGDGLRRARDVGDGRAGAVPGVRVGRQLLVETPAQQVVDGPIERLADDVPQRLLDRADGRVPSFQPIPRDPATILQRVDLFSGMDRRQTEQIGRLLKERRFVEGETVIMEGSGGAAFFIIESGTATVSTPLAFVGLVPLVMISFTDPFTT